MIISGLVVDNTGVPLMGVNVFPIKNGKSYGVGGITDYDGNFEIDIPDIKNNQIIKFSYIGFRPIEVKAETLKNKKIIMSQSVEVLDEVLIIAKKPKNIKKLKQNIEYVYFAGGIAMLGLIIFNIQKYG